MIRLTILYPNEEGSFFDWDYYINIHTPLAKRCYGNAVVRWEIDRGIHGEQSEDAAPYMVAAFITLTSTSALDEVRATHGIKLKADFKNYTNVYPVYLVTNIREGYSYSGYTEQDKMNEFFQSNKDRLDYEKNG